MPEIVGIMLAISVAFSARAIGFDRDRAFYPVVLVIVASYYVLFAVIGGARSQIVTEILICAAFGILAAMGFRASLWLVVIGLAAHGVFDFFRGALFAGSGIPPWWPAFCMAYDLTAATILGALLRIRQRSA